MSFHNARMTGARFSGIVPAMKCAYLLCGFLLLGLLAPSYPAVSQELTTPVITGGVLGENARIVFRWDEKVRFRAKARGTELRLEFETPIGGDLTPITQSLGAHVSAARFTDGGKTLILTLTKPFRVKPFVSRSLSGVDLVADPNPQEFAATTPVASKPVVEELPLAPRASKPAPKPELAQESGGQALNIRAEAYEEFGRLVFQWDGPIRYRVRQDGNKAYIEFDRSALPVLPALNATTRPFFDGISAGVEGELLRYSLNVPTNGKLRYSNENNTVYLDVMLPPKILNQARKEEKAKEIAARPVPVPSYKPDRAPQRKTPVAIAQPVAPKKVPDTKTVHTHPSQKVESVELAPLTPRAVKRPEGYELSFPRDDSVALAVFQHAGDSWIVLSRPTKVDLTGIRALAGTDAVEQVPHDRYTVLRIKNASGLNASVVREPADWKIAMTPEPEPLKNPVSVEVQEDAARGRHLFLPTTSYVNAITVKDPVTGLSLIIAPTYKEGEGMPLTRHFVEAEILKTAQGFVIQAHSDYVTPRYLRKGIMLGVEGGNLQLSPDLPGIDPTILARLQGSTSMIPYEEWKVPEGETLAQVRNYLRNKIVSNLHSASAPWRVRLAQLYLAEGLYDEVLMELGFAEQDDLTYAREHHSNFISAAALFMKGRYEEAAEALGREPKVGSEVDFWKEILAVARKDWTPPFDFRRYAPSFLPAYSPAMQQKIALLAAERKLVEHDIPAAEAILDRWIPAEAPTNVQKHKTYIIGQAAAGKRQASKAIELWKSLTEDVGDRKYRALAELALIKLQMDRGFIEKPAAIERLNQLAGVWRGDEVELETLRLLGQYRIDEGDYMGGLTAWRELVTAFPESEESSVIAQKMADTFIHLFNRGGADNLPPLDALTLYYEFRELTPIGKEGDIMIQNLADRLAGIELLDRAAALLTHQVRYRLKDVERARVGGRVALIYLLNEQPDQALKMLDITRHTPIPEEVAAMRRHLRAQAHNARQEYGQALDVLKDDKTEDGALIKTEALWNLGDWNKTAAFLESQLVGREQSKEPLTRRETEMLLRLGLAYLFAGNQTAMQPLRDRFLPRLAESPYLPTFDFITESSDAIDHNNFDRINREIGVFESFMSTYRDQVEQGKLSQVGEEENPQ